MAAELSFFGLSASFAGVGARSLSKCRSPYGVVCPVRKAVVPLCAASKTATRTTQEKRQPRGITKARPVSPAMQELLGVAEIPRTQAVKEIWNYIKQHGLQDPEDKKVVICDEKLKPIFGGRDRVGFLEISGLINPHFSK
ncbi:SWI/SNF complex component SNF12 homolog [Wolffia australiana]